MENDVPKLKVGEFLNQRKPSLVIKEEPVNQDIVNQEPLEPDNNILEESSVDLNNYLNEVEKADSTTTAEVTAKVVVPFQPVEDRLPVDKPKEVTTTLELYSSNELEYFVKNAAGPFYANYIQHFHPEQLKKGGIGIRQQAAIELIEFGKVLLNTLKKEL